MFLNISFLIFINKHEFACRVRQFWWETAKEGFELFCVNNVACRKIYSTPSLKAILQIIVFIIPFTCLIKYNGQIGIYIIGFQGPNGEAIQLAHPRVQ